MAGTGERHAHDGPWHADRGLCGGFNANAVCPPDDSRELEAEGQEGQAYCIGKKGAQALKREFDMTALIATCSPTSTSRPLSYDKASGRIG